MSTFGKSLKFALCALDDDNKVIAMTEPLTSEWSVDLDESMREMSLSAEHEIGNILVEELKRSIRPIDISKLVEASMEKQNAD